MARVTVEDCIDKIPNRFELVMISGQRVRQVNSGAPITVERDNDKNTVVALREIADETVSIDELKEDMIHSYQKVAPMLEEDQEELEIMQGEEEWQQLVASAGVVVDDDNNIVDSEEAEAEQPDEDDAEAQVDEEAPSLEDLAGAK